MTEVWHAMVAEDDFPESGKLAAQLDGWRVLVARTDNAFNAVNDR